MKKYTFTQENTGAVILSAQNKRDAYRKYKEQGYDVKMRHIDLCTWF